MSGTSQQTSQQSLFAVSNILAHPGSTAAGIAIGLTTIGNVIGSQGIPTTSGGWIQFATTVLFSLLSILGK